MIFLHERMPDNVGSGEVMKFDSGNIFQNARCLDEAGLFGAREIDLRDVAGHDHARFVAEAREKHHHLFRGGILRFVEDDVGIGERPTPHISERRDLDYSFFRKAGDVGCIQHVMQCIVESGRR